MKTIYINDLEVKQIGETAKIAKYIEVNPIEYHLSNGSANCRITFGDEGNMNVDNININFTAEEMAAWGEDDSYIENLILSKIGATKRIITETLGTT